MNGLLDYIEYLFPNDWIQGIFLLIIIVLSFGTALWVKLSTKERLDKKSGKILNCWELRWINKTPTDKNDDLRVEHGSVQELCEAVATPAEKLADALPSMLLVVGLMGTFLGVGVALNNAADVLNDPKLSSDDMLNKMIGSLNALGALFKSSIYGIIGFFSFTLWKNKWGTDENRFKWCVKRCNEELKSKETEAEKFQRFQKENTEKIILALDKVKESIGQSIAECIQNALTRGFEGVNKEIKNQIRETKTVVQQLQTLANQAESQTSTMDSLSETMKEQFTFVASSAQSMGTAANALAKSVDEFKPAVTDTLENIREEFVKSITDGSKVMEDAGVSIRNAVAEMSQKSKEGQDKLDATLVDFSQRINSTLSGIKDASLAMEINGNKNIQTMNELSEKISERLMAISRANLVIKSGMKDLPKDLSDSINVTLQEVRKSIETSVSKSADKVVNTLETVFDDAAKPLPAKGKLVNSKEISA